MIIAFKLSIVLTYAIMLWYAAQARWQVEQAKRQERFELFGCAGHSDIADKIGCKICSAEPSTDQGKKAASVINAVGSLIVALVDARHSTDKLSQTMMPDFMQCDVCNAKVKTPHYHVDNNLPEPTAAGQVQFYNNALWRAEERIDGSGFNWVSTPEMNKHRDLIEGISVSHELDGRLAEIRRDEAEKELRTTPTWV